MPEYWSNMLVSIAPFVLLLALWFFLLRTMRRGKGSTQQTLIEPMRSVIREEVVPEIRALRDSVDALRRELADRR